MGIPPSLFFDQDQAPPQGGSLDDALFNSPQVQQPQQQPQQQMPPMASYPSTPDSMSSLNAQPQPLSQTLQQAQVQAQQAPGGPVKQGLRGVLLHIMRNVMAGGIPMAAYPGDIMQESHDRNQAALAQTQAQTGLTTAQTGLVGAETQNQQSETRARNIQNRPQILIDPQSGDSLKDENGFPRVGTLADQKELNENFKTTGGYFTLTPALTASIGDPTMTGMKLPMNTISALVKDQSSKTLESELVRHTQAAMAKGISPQDSPDVQALVALKKATQSYTPAMEDEKYRELWAAQHGGQKLTPDQQNWMAAYEKQKTLVPQFNLKVQNSDGGLGPNGSTPAAPATPGAPGANPPAPAQKTITQVPQTIRSAVQAVLDYREPMPPQGRNNVRNNAIRDWVNTIDPTYDETTFPARNTILKSFTSGPESNSINAINTALGHLGDLNTANEAMNHNDLPLLHSIAAKLGAASGDDAATTYQNILHRVSPEVTTAYLANGGAANERGANESDFEQGYQQNKSNIAETAQLLHSKTAALNQQWTNTFRPSRPEDQFDARFLTPAAKATLSQLSAQAPTNRGMVMMRAPNGETRSVPAEKVAGFQAKGATVVNR